MKRLGPAICFAVAALGVGLFAQAAKADDAFGLTSYTWWVSLSGRTSTWCFSQDEDGTYYGDEVGMGAAHADVVAYNPETRVLEMNATSDNGNDIAQYTWVMMLDDDGLPTNSPAAGTITFSRWIDPDTKEVRTDPLTQEVWIGRGDPRPSAPCD